MESWKNFFAFKVFVNVLETYLNSKICLKPYLTSNKKHHTDANVDANVDAKKSSLRELRGVP